MNKIDDIEKTIMEKKVEIQKLEKEIRELQFQISGFYIGVAYRKYNDFSDYWDEYFCPLGLITEKEAIDWVNRNNDYPVNNWPGTGSPYYKVSENIYNKFKKTARLFAAMDYCPTNDKICESLWISIRSEYEHYIKELSNYIEHPSFQYVCPVNYYMLERG